MNSSVYIFAKSGETLLQYPNDYTNEIFTRFVTLSFGSEQIIIHRNDKLVYYGYTRKIDANHSNDIVGLCVVFNNIVYYDLRKVAEIFSNTINNLLESNFFVFNPNESFNYILSKRKETEQLRIDLGRKFEKLTSCEIPPLDISQNKDSERNYTLENYLENINEIYNFRYVSINCEKSIVSDTKTIKFECARTNVQNNYSVSVREVLKYQVPFYVVFTVCPLLLLVILAVGFDGSLMSHILLGYSIIYLITSIFSVFCIKKRVKRCRNILTSTLIFGAFFSLLCVCSEQIVISVIGRLIFLANTFAYIVFSLDGVKQYFPNLLTERKQNIICVSFSIVLFLLSIGVLKTNEIQVKVSPSNGNQEEISPPKVEITTPSPNDTPIETHIGETPQTTTSTEKKTPIAPKNKIEHNVTIRLSYGEYTGDAMRINGIFYPNGDGKLIYNKEYTLPFSHAQKVFAGEYVVGKFERGFLVRGFLYKADSTLKSKVTIGTPPKEKLAER